MEADKTLPVYPAAAFRLLMLTGCRRNEIATLRWEHVDLEDGEVRLFDSKTGARMVPLSPPAARVLAELPRIKGNPCVPGFSDAAEPSRPHESGRSVLPSVADKASALRIIDVSTLNSPAARTATDTSHDASRHPAHGSRWKRFVTPFLPPDFHRLSTSELA